MGSKLRGRRIAVGVSDEAFRDALRRTLEREGATVAVHATGAALLASARRQPPHLCIVDVDLPDLGPERLIQSLREGRKDLPVVLVSAHLLPADIPSLKGLPTLPLPFSKNQLFAVLDAAIGGIAA